MVLGFFLAGGGRGVVLTCAAVVTGGFLRFDPPGSEVARCWPCWFCEECASLVGCARFSSQDCEPGEELGGGQRGERQPQGQ